MIKISNLHVSVEGQEILKGVDLVIKQGEVHAVMGKNGSGKSTLAFALMGHPKYKITNNQETITKKQTSSNNQLQNNQTGAIEIDGVIVDDLGPDERAEMGLFLANQYPAAVPGLGSTSFLWQIYKKKIRDKGVKIKENIINIVEFRKWMEEQAKALDLNLDLLKRGLNDGFSGGEKKKMEILQMLVSNPKYLILDEIDSGLDVDALKKIATTVAKVTKLMNVGVIIITHYSRILKYIKVDRVHIMEAGAIKESGDSSLIEKIENSGFDKTKMDYVYKLEKGLNEEVVLKISQMKNEPLWMTAFRLKAYETFLKKDMPTWGADLSKIDFEEIFYYVRATDKTEKDWKDVPKEIKETYDRIGIPEAEKQLLGGVKAQYESEVVYGSLLKRFSDMGIIFCGMDEAVEKYPELVQEYFGKLIPYGDNKFAALNSAVWSGGSFIYVPKGVKVDLPLQAYFRINMANMGQFERTLIIVDEGAFIHYVEGCFLAGAGVSVEENSLKKIEDMVVGDKVLTHTGQYQSVKKLIKREYDGEILRIKYYGDSGAELKVTEEHPLLVVKRKSDRDRNKEFSWEWVFAKDLSEKDYLVMPIIRNTVDRKEFVNGDVRIPLEPDFFRLMGYFFAEGHIDNEHYITFSFNKDEHEYLNDVKQLVKKYFDKTVIENKVRQNGQTLVVCSTKYARLLAAVVGSTIRDKRIPSWLLNSSDENVSELVKGMWRGDGSYDKKANVFRYNSVSENLAQGYKNILLRLGILVDINLQKRKLPRKDMYVVLVTRANNEKFAKILGINGIKNGLLQGSPVTMSGDYVYLPVKRITREKYMGFVYNLSVENDETYVCEGVVSHNCTAPIYTTDSLHAAVVEIFVKKGARCRYTTIQNWSKNVYNLVTKRARVEEDGVMEWVDGNLGSKVTMKYPAVVLAGKGAHGEILSVAVAGKGQHLDAGAKCIHLAAGTTSRVISKSISFEGGRASYRGLIQMVPGAKNSRSKVVCDALIMDKDSRSDTYPTNKIQETQVTLEHEATVSKIGEEQLFYLMSRGFNQAEAEAMIVNGFIEPIAKELPMEYSVELNRLINMQMEGSVG